MVRAQFCRALPEWAQQDCAPTGSEASGSSKPKTQNSEPKTWDAEPARRCAREIRLISRRALVLTRALSSAQPILAGTPYPMTLQYCFAEYRSADWVFLYAVGSELARAVGQGVSKLTGLRNTGLLQMRGGDANGMTATPANGGDFPR